MCWLICVCFCFHFQCRKHKDLYMWMVKSPNGPSVKFLVKAGKCGDPLTLVLSG